MGELTERTGSNSNPAEAGALAFASEIEKVGSLGRDLRFLRGDSNRQRGET